VPSATPLTRTWQAVLRIGYLWLLAFAPGLAAEPFRDGDRWVAIGDSITHTGLYQSYIRLFVLTREPSLNLQLRNRGVNGDTTPGAIARYAWDIDPVAPTVATVFLGMNDLGRFFFMPTGVLTEEQRLKHRDEFREQLGRLLDLLSSRGVRGIVISPSLYDETAIHKGLAPARGTEQELVQGLAIARQVARSRNVAFVDVLSPMTDLTRRLQEKDPSFSLISPDRVHPAPAGHFVIATAFLTQLGAEPEVAHIELNGGDASGSRHCRVSAVHIGESGGGFDCREDALPFPVPAEVAGVASAIGFDGALNREFLTVSKLQAGTYRLTIDGEKVADFTATELTTGINLARETSTPQYRQAVRVAALEHRRFEVESRLRILAQWRQFMVNNGIDPSGGAASYERMDELISRWHSEGRALSEIFAKQSADAKEARYREGEWLSEIADLERQSRDLAVPQVHHYALSAVSR
jgi:lysophospholipase L1-like esterase